ncbi:C6 transcription factor [Pseudozyma hubeiensis SY62]|uniref:C6 transcription factor n=1 Tax=Pseudozyma hubeiensis (strain SY62) TaxID=1305764 RepID=R9P8J2_PSEHS|nr:C6 transcription factor [Pseudozyma hubeiensis SY62]GAC94385.1 C6 transcription factor [Pseudozyma hubeiensis SY62]
MNNTNVSPTALTTQAAAGSSDGLAGGSSSVKNLSCLQCRKRKTRCDKKYPCSPCVIRGDASSCTQVQQTIASITTSSFGASTSPTREAAPLLHRASFSDAVGSSANLSSVATAAHAPSSSSSSKLEPRESPFATDRFIGQDAERLYRLEVRMDRMERHVLGNRLQRNDSHFTSNSISDTAQDDTLPSVARIDSTQELPVGQDIQDLFEDAAMGRKHKLKSLPLGTAAAAVDTEAKDPETDEEQMLDQRSPDSSVDVAFRFAQFLPHQSAVLLEFYFAHVDWTTRVLPSESYDEFLRLSKLQPEQIAAFPVSSAMVCCYFVIVALSLHFADAALLEKVGISKKEASRLADTLCTGSQQLLWSSNFLQSQQLEHLACICLLGVYQHNRKEQAEGQWALLGSAIKVAQNMGLARLDHGSASRKPFGSMTNEARRELGRRIWWNLTWLDWSHSVAHFGVYSVHPSQNRTNLPANVDIHNDSLTLRSQDVYTHSSAITMRMRYVIIYREIVDLSNEGPKLSRAQIHRFVSKLNEVHDSTPACLRYSPDRTFDKPDQAMEAIMLELMYLNRILRLHRVHQLSGFTDDEWRFARKACLSSASCIIRILSLQQDSAIHKFWLVSFFLLGASMALVMELCCARQDELDAASVRASLSTAVSLLSKAGPGSEAARNSRRILKELLSAENKIRSAFARLGGLERIAETRLDTSGPKDVFLDVLQKVFHSMSRCKRKREIDDGSGGTQAAKRRIEAADSARQTRESTASSVGRGDGAAGSKTRGANGHASGHVGNGTASFMEGGYSWLDPNNFGGMTADGAGGALEALSVGDGTVASNESDWQGDQTLFPSLDGILSGALSIDEWLGSSYPFDHL